MKPSSSLEQATRLTLGVPVEEFAAMLRISERSAWTILANEAKNAAREGHPNPLPLITVFDGGNIKRLRISDIETWWSGRM